MQDGAVCERGRERAREPLGAKERGLAASEDRASVRKYLYRYGCMRWQHNYLTVQLYALCSIGYRYRDDFRTNVVIRARFIPLRPSPSRTVRAPGAGSGTRMRHRRTAARRVDANPYCVGRCLPFFGRVLRASRCDFALRCQCHRYTLYIDWPRSIHRSNFEVERELFLALAFYHDSAQPRPRFAKGVHRWLWLR